MTNTHMYPALSIMERELTPARYGREPFWRPPVVPASAICYTPHWNWIGIHEVADDAATLTLDTNAAYLGAIGTVKVAYGALKHTGALQHLPHPREVHPGYYLIGTPYWAFSGTIVSPLGDSARLQTEDSLWVAHPTLVLLLELEDEGSLGQLTIHDSYTCDTGTGFRAWVDTLKAVRLGCMDQVDLAHPDGRPSKCACSACSAYGAFKEGYSAALSMMLTGEKCKTRRPDWAHAVYAQHAATQWRKAWRWTGHGRPLIRMGATDEITILADDLHEILAKPKPPFRYDDTGRLIGALKPKPDPEPDPEAAQQPQALPLVDEGDDIL